MKTLLSSYQKKFIEFLEGLLALGFQQVLKEEIDRDENVVEYFYIYWHKERHLLMTIDTFDGGLNACNVYFEGAKKDDSIPGMAFNIINGGGSSCMVKEGIYSINFYISSLENYLNKLRIKLSYIEQYFNTQPKWLKRENGTKKTLWLLSYMDTKKPFDVQVINSGRIAKLPLETQEMINY